MAGFTPLDLAVVVGYLAAVLLVGIVCRLRKPSAEEYFLGGRRFGRLLQTFASFGQATTADGPVGVATATYHNGISGAWASLLMVFSTPLYWISAAWLRRLRILTMGDFYVERYGSRAMGAAYALIATAGMMSVLSAGYVAVSKTAVAMSGGALDPSYVLIAVCLVTVANAALGGLAAAFYASLLQAALLVALSVLLVPVGLARLGAQTGASGLAASLHQLHARLAPDYFRLFGAETLPDFTWYYIAAVSTVAGITIITQPQHLVSNAAARNEQVARFGMVTGTLIKRVCAIFWAMTGLIALALMHDFHLDSDLVWGASARALLAPMGMGLLGLTLAAMLSALMAVSNSLALTIAALLTHNLYRPLVAGKSEGHYVVVGRAASVVFLCGGMYIASRFQELFDLLKLNWEFFVIFAGAFWLGLKWRRANRAGAWASILATLIVFYLVPIMITDLCPGLRSCPALNLVARRPRSASIPPGEAQAQAAIFWSLGVTTDADGRLRGHGYPYLDLLVLQASGVDLRKNVAAANETLRLVIRLLFPFSVLIGISLLTAPDESERARRFFVRMATPVDPRGTAYDNPVSGGTLEAPGVRRLIPIFPGTQWEFHRWSRRDALGFATAVVLTAGIVALLAAAASVGG